MFNQNVNFKKPKCIQLCNQDLLLQKDEDIDELRNFLTETFFLKLNGNENQQFLLQFLDNDLRQHSLTMIERFNAYVIFG